MLLRIWMLVALLATAALCEEDVDSSSMSSADPADQSPEASELTDGKPKRPPVIGQAKHRVPQDPASDKSHIEEGPFPPQHDFPGGIGPFGPTGLVGPELWGNNNNMADMPKIVSLDVKCEKNFMKVFLAFDKPFFGIVFSKGHYNNANCVHLPAGLGRTSVNFEVGIHACGTAGNTENGLYGYGADSGSGTFFENTIVVQYDPQVQEVWDQARKLRCTWHEQYEKSVTFRPFAVDMLDVVRADFAGDNVGCWMQIQVGKGPWASEVSGLVKIGQTMTMVLAIKEDDTKFDMLVRNCMAHDGKRAPIQLVDQRGCVTRSKLMSKFTKIKNFGASASVLSYAHFQAFKFPDSMEVHFQCTIQICRYQCPEQCSSGSGIEHANFESDLLQYGPPPLLNRNDGPIDPYLAAAGRPRDERRLRRSTNDEEEVGVAKVIRVVSTGDLTFNLEDNDNSTTKTMVFPIQTLNENDANSGYICMTTIGFAATLVVLLCILIVSCLLSAFLYVKLRPLSKLNSSNNVELSSSKIQQRNCFFIK